MMDKAGPVSVRIPQNTHTDTSSVIKRMSVKSLLKTAQKSIGQNDYQSEPYNKGDGMSIHSDRLHVGYKQSNADRPLSVMVDVVTHDEPSVCSVMSYGPTINGLPQTKERREQEKPNVKKVNQKDHNGSVCSVMDPFFMFDDNKSEMHGKENKINCCSLSLKKVCSGVLILFLVTSSWVGATQFLKVTYHNEGSKTNATNFGIHDYLHHHCDAIVYSAPFFTCWFCTSWTILFFPLYIACSGCNTSTNTVMMLFRQQHFTWRTLAVNFLSFCMLSVLTNYLYIASLRDLDCTVVTALFATNASFVYILSWVILHQQFVGIRIVAVILCTTGISLLAYMDGVNKHQTLFSVILASSSAAGSAIYKVMFKKVIGEVNFHQVSLFFSVIGILNTVLLWPIAVTLYFTGIETLNWQCLPWTELCGAASLSLVANLLANFSIIITYENFITCGMIAAVPASAAYDILMNKVVFSDMKLTGIIFICCGFLLVLTPTNWAAMLRKIISWRRPSQNLVSCVASKVDLRTGYIEARLRSPSGRVR